MNPNNDYPRMLDKQTKPVEGDILEFVGDFVGKAWLELKKYLSAHYDHEHETVFYGKKYGWTVRYRRSGRTLCSLFPEKGAFTVLIVLGKKEVVKITQNQSKMSSSVQDIFNTTDQLHDGRWLWIRVIEEKEIADIIHLLSIKRKPKIMNV